MNPNLLFSFVPAFCLVAGACTVTPSIPDALQPGDGAVLAMVLPAKGVQIYECRASKAAAGGYEWAFVAPEAELFDMRGNEIGRHGAGPFWEASDGSRIVGSVKARADAPAAGSIPWLLLAAESTGPAGRFSGVTRIQRVNTLGGLPPTKPCSGDTLGGQAGVHYTADYRFFTSNTKR